MAREKSEDADLRLIPENLQFEPGFNIKTLWAALFVGFVMLPGAIYLGLVTGQSMAGGAEIRFGGAGEIERVSFG